MPTTIIFFEIVQVKFGFVIFLVCEVEVSYVEFSAIFML